MEMSFTLGNLLQMAVTIVAVVGAYTRLVQRITAVETKVEVLLERRTFPRR
jgi:hypothetical protein